MMEVVLCIFQKGTLRKTMVSGFKMDVKRRNGKMKV